jgi:heme/copper-type cytochrome/quinol oxidase subunit 2
MALLAAAILFAQEAQEEVRIDAAEEGKKIIIGMLIVGLIFIAVIALGQLSKWAAHRREARRRHQAY